MSLVDTIKTKTIKDIILDKRKIIDSDFYCPFKNEDGSPDLTREIFEFDLKPKDLHFEVEQSFLMLDYFDKQVLRYLVLSIKECPRHKGYLKVRALFKGRL